VVCGDCREVGAGLLDSGAPEAWSSTLCTLEKYNSRTPQLYSEELSQAAALATRIQEDKVRCSCIFICINRGYFKKNTSFC